MVKDGNSSGPVEIEAGRVTLKGDLTIPKGAGGLVLFAHGSGSGRHSPRNRFVAGELNKRGIATLLFDLLTEEEEVEDMASAQLRFNIPMLTKRLAGATEWALANPKTSKLKIGYFGASTGAAAAIMAAAEKPKAVAAVVSRGGRPDLAAEVLPTIRCPILLIVGGDDEMVIELNRLAFEKIKSERKKLLIVAGATHLFEEKGKLEEVAQYACEWFLQYLGGAKGR
ncbi:MAG: dienelactone hydrolase family protein [Candidatus Micrarchaeota archaeon]|nr:dienelactone hydrolase family protein [Candidatus Micrarchaeota archaeon]